MPHRDKTTFLESIDEIFESLEPVEAITPHGAMAISEEDAARLVQWAVETLAAEVAVPVDPVQARRLARMAVEGRDAVEVTEAQNLLSRALEAARLSPVEAGDVSDVLATVELPIVTLSGGGLAITSRSEGRLTLLRPDGSRQTLSVADARAQVVENGGTWLTAAPSAPLQELTSHDHHHHATPWERLKALMHLEGDDLWVVLVYAVAVGLFSLATPVAVQSLVSTVAFGTLLQPIVVLSLLLLVALGFQSGLRALQVRVVEALQQRVFARTALDLAWRLPRVKPEAAREGFGPESVNRFFDVLTVQKTAHTLLTDGLEMVLLIGIGVLVLAFYHPMLLGFAIVLVAALSALLWMPARKGLATSIGESYAKYEVAAWLEQLARPGAAFRGAGGAAMAAERAEALTRRYLTARRSHFTVLFGQTIGALVLQVVASAALLGLGGWLVVQRELTLGQLVAAELIVAAVTSSMSKLGKMLDSAYDLLTALDKLGHLLDLPVEDPDAGGEVIPGEGAVAVEVREATDGRGTPLTFDVAAGARVAISGAQDRRLGEWLAALSVPAHGSIALNGVETDRARSPRLRDRVAIIQHDDVFDGSVMDNVSLGRTQVTSSEVRAALEKVGLLEEVRALPDGLDTRLIPGGMPLTPSQHTRLLVARAIAGSPRLIVVDESLESVEPLARARCVSALTRASSPWTLIALVDDQSVALARACSQRLKLEELDRPAPRPESSAS